MAARPRPSPATWENVSSIFTNPETSTLETQPVADSSSAGPLAAPGDTSVLLNVSLVAALGAARTHSVSVTKAQKDVIEQSSARGAGPRPGARNANISRSGRLQRSTSYSVASSNSASSPSTRTAVSSTSSTSTSISTTSSANASTTPKQQRSKQKQAPTASATTRSRQKQYPSSTTSAKQNSNLPIRQDSRNPSLTKTQDYSPNTEKRSDNTNTKSETVMCENPDLFSRLECNEDVASVEQQLRDIAATLPDLANHFGELVSHQSSHAVPRNASRTLWATPSARIALSNLLGQLRNSDLLRAHELPALVEWSALQAGRSDELLLQDEAKVTRTAVEELANALRVATVALDDIQDFGIEMRSTKHDVLNEDT